MPTCAVSKSVQLPVPHEGNRYRPANDADDVRQQWKRQEDHRSQAVNDKVSLNEILRKIEGMRRRILGGSGGVSEGLNFRGEYDPTANYDVGDIVVISGGANAGSFICIQQNSAQAPQLPDIGNLYWVSLSGNVPVLGAWMV